MVVVSALALLYTLMEVRIGSLGAPGPGLWPLLICVVMLGAAVAIPFTDRSAAGVGAFHAGAGRVALGLVTIGLFIWLYERVGFAIPSFLALVVWLRVIGKRRLWESLVYAAVVTAVLYVLFDRFLNVPFPDGPLTQYLGY